MSEQNVTYEEVERVARAGHAALGNKALIWERISDEERNLVRRLIRGAIAAMKESRAATERWAAFGRAVMKQHKDGDCGDVDGGWLQETGVQTGVLQIVEAKEPCAEEGCMCAATCGDWPVDCYRVVTP